MTASDLAGFLIETTLATSAAIVLVLLLRAPLHALGGWRATYALWALVPAAWLAVLLPAPVRYVTDMAVQFSPALASTSQVAAAETMSAVNPVLAMLALWAFGALLAAQLYVRRQQSFVRGLGVLHQRRDNLLQAEACAGLPAVMGLLPKIILPADFDTRYQAEEQHLILAH